MKIDDVTSKPLANVNLNVQPEEKSFTPKKKEKERLFRRKDEGSIGGAKRQLKKVMNLNCNNGEDSFHFQLVHVTRE